MKKRLLALFLGTVLLMISLTACGGGKTSSKTATDGKATEVVIASYYKIGPDETATTYQEQKKHMEDVQKQYNVKFTFNLIPQWEEYTNQYVTQAASGVPMGDICFIDYTLAYPSFVAKQYVAPIPDGLIAAKDSWNVEASKGLMKDGKYYGLITTDQQIPIEVLLFNKKLFSDLKLPDLYELQASGAWTWDKFLEVARSATKNGKFGIGAYGKLGYMSHAFLLSNNANFVTAGDNPTYQLDKPEAQKALQFSYDLYYKYNVAEVITADKDNWDYTKNQFTSGNSAMLICESWQAEMFKEPMKNDKFGIVAIPKGPDAKDYAANFSKGAAGFIPPAAKLNDVKNNAINAFFAPYSGKPTFEERIERLVLDDQSIDTFKLLAKNSTFNYNIGMVYNTMSGNSDFGLAKKTSPSTFAASIKPTAEKEIADAWKTN